MKNLLPIAIGLFVAYRILKKKAGANAGSDTVGLPQPPKAPPPSAYPDDPSDQPTTYPPAGGTGGIYTGGGHVQPL